MLNCSPSSKAHLCSDDDVVDREAVEPQKLFFSVGDGGTKTPESLISALCISACEVYAIQWLTYHSTCIRRGPLHRH